MRNLLALILLVVFALQATVVVVEGRFATKDKVEYVVAAADARDQTGTTDDDSQLSLNAIEELSDYVVIEPLIPVGSLRASLISPSETVFLPADLQGLKPPPRA